MDLELNCPHCNGIIIVVNTSQINCSIFRHAVYKNTMQQIPPHESKINCDKLIETNSVYGCARPFKVIKEKDKYITITCDYI